jgi:hypothetical protein
MVDGQGEGVVQVADQEQLFGHAGMPSDECWGGGWAG